MLEAGRLRHRIAIQARQNVRDEVTGESGISWTDVPGWTSVPAAIEPLSARELIAAQAQHSQVTARIVIRWRAGVTAQHRILHNGDVWNVEGVIPDPDSGREWLTLPVYRGTNDGR